MKNLIFTFLLFSVVGCQSRQTDWKAVYESGLYETAVYNNTRKQEHFDNAIKIYDRVAKGSTEYHNMALLKKSILMKSVGKYMEAIESVKEVPDTASVFPALSKNIYINIILMDSYLAEGNQESYRECLKKTIDELETVVYNRQDSIYYAMCNSETTEEVDEQTTVVRNHDLVALTYYLHFLYQYDYTEWNTVVLEWKNGAPVDNDKVKNFFALIDQAYGI